MCLLKKTITEEIYLFLIKAYDKFVKKKTTKDAFVLQNHMFSITTRIVLNYKYMHASKKVT